MIVAKQIADLITFTRLGIAIFMVWLGVSHGSDALALVIWLMLTDWVGDFLDGNLARRSSRQYHTWIGDHDLLVDMSVAAGLLIYLVAAHLLNPWIGWIYLVIWSVLFLWIGIPFSLGNLFQAPVYGYFLWIVLTIAPKQGIWLIVWIVTVVVITWPKFPRTVVPNFLLGFREVHLPPKRDRQR